MMNQPEKAELLEQLEQWNKKDEYSRCIRAIEAIPEQERGYLLTVKLSRAYSNLAVLGDHGEHGQFKHRLGCLTGSEVAELSAVFGLHKEPLDVVHIHHGVLHCTHRDGEGAAGFKYRKVKIYA